MRQRRVVVILPLSAGNYSFRETVISYAIILYSYILLATPSIAASNYTAGDLIGKAYLDCHTGTMTILYPEATMNIHRSVTLELRRRRVPVTHVTDVTSRWRRMK